MYILKWIELDDKFDYYPCAILFYSYEALKQRKEEKLYHLKLQSFKPEEIYEGKIVSDLYVSEIELNVLDYIKDWKLFKLRLILEFQV